MSDKIKLNLGRFDECVTNVNYKTNLLVKSLGRDPDSLVFYYKFEGCRSANMGPGVIDSTKLGKDFQIPTFSIGRSTNCGRTSDPDAVKVILAKIELKIFSMLQKIVAERGCDIKLGDIIIPIKKIEVFDDGKINGCYGWAELGIAIVVPVPVEA